MVGTVRFELTTSTMSWWHSNQLSYAPLGTIKIIKHSKNRIGILSLKISANKPILKNTPPILALFELKTPKQARNLKNGKKQ